MATLGDLNPNLYKKSQLQIENEARAAQQAQQTALDKQSKDYIGQGADPSKINAMQEPAPFVEPGMNLKLVQQNENAYMGPMQTMGQQTPGAFQQTDLQKQNAALANPQQQAQQPIQGESDLMRQAREHNQSMLNSGIYNGQQQPENLQQYDVNAVNAQRGYVKNYGGKVNIAPELFTGKQLQGITQSTGAATTKAQQLDQAAQAAQAKIQGQFMNDQNQGDYIAAKNARDAANAYKNSHEYQQEQAAIAQQQQAMQDRNNAEMAQNTRMSTGETQQGVNTGNALFDSQAQLAGQVAQDEIQMAQDLAYQKDQAARQGMINSLWQTNLQDLGYQKEDLNKMSMDQLMQVANTDGLNISKSMKDRLSAAGKAQIENEKLAQTNELADNEMTKRQIERQLGRSLQEREQFNVQQDTKLRRMLGMFGGGQVQDLAGNMAVMDAQEKGKTALADLRADYGDRMDSLGRQYTQISQTHTNNINQIESQISTNLEGAYANLMGKFEQYANAGITNKAELNKVMLSAKKDYLKNYVDITSKGAEFMQKQNENTFNQLMKLQENQRAEDKAMSDLYGVSYRNGQPVLDQNGNRVPTFEMMKFANEQDKFMTEQQGIFYQNGRPMLDSRGQTIETMTAQKNANDQFWKQKEYGAKQDELRRLVGNDEYNRRKDYAEATGDYSVLGYGDTGSGNGYGATPPGAISGSRYGATIKQNGTLELNLPKNANGEYKTIPGREQCGAYVNDALGLSGDQRMGDSIQQKISLTKLPDGTINTTPYVGGAFVQKLSGKYAANGHTGVITKTYLDGSFDFSSANADGKANGSITTGHMTAEQAQKKGIVGFTVPKNVNAGAQPVQAGLSQVSQQVKNYATMAERNGGNLSGLGIPKAMMQQVVNYMAQTPQAVNNSAEQSAQDIMNPFSGMTLDDIKQDNRPAVAKVLNKLKTEAMKQGDLIGMVKASAGGKQITDTLRTSLSKAMRVDQELQNLEQTMGKEFTDPILGIARSFDSYDTKAQLIRAQLTSIVPTLARGVYGEVGVLTNTDIENYIKTLPNLQSTEKVRAALLDMTRNKIKNAIKNDLESAARSNYNVSGFADLPLLQDSIASSNTTSQPQWSWGNMVSKITMKDPEGNPIYVPASDVQEALQNGATY